MSTDPGDHLVHQARIPTSPLLRESLGPREGPFTGPLMSNLYYQSFSPSSQPTDLDMEVYSPVGARPESPPMPLSPSAMVDDTPLGVLSIPISLSSTDTFDQQFNIVTSSLHSIADWLETVNWDGIFGRNPLDASTLNSNPLASAATRVIRYLNAGIAGRSPKVPELQTPPAQPNRVNNTQRAPQQATRPPSAPPGNMTYARAASRASPAPSNNYTSWTVSRPSSQQSTSVDAGFDNDISRLREAHPDLTVGELLALQRHYASTRAQRPRRVSLPRGSRRAIHVVFTETRPNLPPRPAVVVHAVNSRLPAERRAFQAASASWSSRNNVTIRFAQAPEDPELNAVRGAIRALFPDIPPTTYTVEKRHIISTVMFHRLALVHHDGSPISAEQYAQELKASLAWQDIHIPRPPRLVPDKDTHVGTLYVDFQDNGSLTALRHVMREPALLQGESVFPVKYHKRDTVPQCSACLRWGHSRPVCRSTTHRCNHCGGNHSEHEHRQWAACCHGNPPTPAGTPCPHPPKCANCGSDHKATDRACAFYEHRHNREWINLHQPRAETQQPPHNNQNPRQRNTRTGLGRSQGPQGNRRVRFLVKPSASPADPSGPQNIPARDHSAHPSQAYASPSHLV